MVENYIIRFMGSSSEDCLNQAARDCVRYWLYPQRAVKCAVSEQKTNNSFLFRNNLYFN